MKRSTSTSTITTLFFLFVMCIPNAYAQMYKWLAPNGNVNYSDSQPPSNAKLLESKPIKATTTNVEGLTYELIEAIKNNPVLLYTTDKCDACDEGRNLLKNRGIPFSEKTVSTYEDIQALRPINENKQLPLLLVGRLKQVGYQSDLWNKALTAARYPETNQLPKNFQNKAAEPAAPPILISPVSPPNSVSPLEKKYTPPSDDAAPAFRF